MKTKIIIAALFLSVFVLIPIAGATAITASNFIQYSNNPNVNTASTSMVKLAELTMNDSYTGSFRVYFELACGDWHNQCVMDGVNTYARVYKNGVIYGALWDWQGGSPSQAFQYLPYSQDFTGLTISAGDKIQLYAYENNAAASGVAYVQNFSVKFDTPTLVSLNSNKDTYVSSAAPTTNYGTGTQMQIDSSSYYSLIQFDTSSIPSNSTINSATMYIYENSGGNSGSNVLAYNVTSSWTETGVTWNTVPTYNPVSFASSPGLDALAWYPFNIKSTVEGWVNGTLQNNGILTKMDVGGYNLYFYTKEYSSGAYSPYIAVNFTPKYTPPAPTNIASTTGNFWVNTTWSAGSGNITDSYNVSANGVWVNGSTATFINQSLLPHGWDNITVYAFNSTAGGNLSTTNASLNTQIPDNPVVISNISDTYSITAGQTLYIYPSSSDLDSDTATFSTTATKGTFYTNNGTLIWTTVGGDAGTYNWQITANDGNGSTSTKTFGVSVSSQTPGQPLNLAQTAGNFWMNYTWSPSVNTNRYNISVNGVWHNGSLPYYNATGLNPHQWVNISVAGWNDTSKTMGALAIGNNTVPNNAPVVNLSATTLSSGSVNQYETETITTNITDADSDPLNVTVGLTYGGTGVESNYTMLLNPNTNTYTYGFSTGEAGTYTVNIYANDSYTNVSSVTGLSFVVATTQANSGGGGGGGNAGVGTPTPNQTNITYVGEQPLQPPIINLQSLATEDPIGLTIVQAMFALGVIMFAAPIVAPKKIKFSTAVLGLILMGFSYYAVGGNTDLLFAWLK